MDSSRWYYICSFQGYYDTVICKFNLYLLRITGNLKHVNLKYICFSLAFVYLVPQNELKKSFTTGKFKIHNDQGRKLMQLGVWFVLPATLLIV